ncbi:hypothetical protein [Streptomyces cavernae]|uniref:hypothetical protein n=1 Tax=Streptomyces cavernae TaxID=2259034 RepID=UPI000FEBC75C|nr:hypothetical protein [Streptomyces cavernae]
MTTANGLVLYVRSRAVPLTLGRLAAIMAFAAYGAHSVDVFLDPQRRAPVVVLAPVFAAAVIGSSLYAAADELDRTAVRPWWPPRLAHLLGLTALAAVVPALTVIGDAEGFGAAAVVRNTLGSVGVTAVAAVLVGARLSWLPAFGYLSAVYVAVQGAHGRAATVWAWPLQPGAQPGSWAAALTVFAAGAVLYALRGARPERLPV